MSDHRVRYEKKDHVAHVTMDRPDVLNAMDRRMHAELAEIWDDVEADDEIRAVVLTGAGAARSPSARTSGNARSSTKPPRSAVGGRSVIPG